MPLSKKGREIMANMKGQYGADKGESVFYASKNKGTIQGVESAHEKLREEFRRQRRHRRRPARGR